jgi:deoxyribodipyrimidine photo-lyase
LPARYRRVIAWLRRDLRIADNAALFEACRQAGEVVPLFVLDKAILARPDTGSARVDFLLRSLGELDESLRKKGGRLIVRTGSAHEAVPEIVRETGAQAVFVNREYEPHLRARDEQVSRALQPLGVEIVSFKDQMLVEPWEVRTGSGTPYLVYGAYFRAWSQMPVDKPFPTPDAIPVPKAVFGVDLPEIADLGFTVTQRREPAGEAAALALLSDFVQNKLEAYGTARDYPARRGTSLLSRHLHFGTIAPRTIAAAVLQGERTVEGHESSASFLREMAWREFYIQVLYHFPRVMHEAFHREFDQIAWENDPVLFDAWRNGQTGYPIVDAGMRQLKAEAWMPNRVRMIAASFLVKDLLCDWRLGERHFMQHLVDGDIAANNGGWQWVAGTGPSAQPYFRIMNITSQGKKFDPDGEYVKMWVPELAQAPPAAIHTPEQLTHAERAYLGCQHYPLPIVDRAIRRQIALSAYQAARRKQDL